MFASLLYYLFLKNRDWSFGRKFALGIIFVYITYYATYYGMFQNQVYSKTFSWLVVIDLFILAVFLMKYKNMKWNTFIDRGLHSVT